MKNFICIWIVIAVSFTMPIQADETYFDDPQLLIFGTLENGSEDTGDKSKFDDCWFEVDVVSPDKLLAHVLFDPPLPAYGSVTQTFKFDWPMKSGYCSEHGTIQTTYKKETFGYEIPIFGSSIEVFQPAPLCIEGTLEATVHVIGSIRCKATKIVTIE